MTHTTDPLGDAITVLENVKIEDPSARMDTEDAHNRVNLALDYLRMIGTTRVLSPTDPPFDPHPDGYPRLNEIAAIASTTGRSGDFVTTPERNGTTLRVPSSVRR